MAENPMEQVNKLLGGGWGDLDLNKVSQQNTHQQAMDRYDAALTIAGPFQTEAGKAALAKLRAMTVDAPTWDGESRDFQAAAAYGFVREGQNSIIRHIENCLKIIENGPPRPEGDNNG